jgi:hypothetical protein
MPALVYRITEVLSAIVIDLPVGTNLGLFYILWTLLSGRLLQSRGALIPALAATGLEPAAVRRAWAAFAHGAWDISQLVTALRTVVRQEGRWHAQYIGGYRVVAVDTTGFFRPRLKNCATKHYLSQAGEALPAIPFGLTPCPTRRVRVASVGAVADQTVTLVRQVMRAPSPTATEAEMVRAVLAHTATQLAPDEAVVVDRGFPVGKLHAAGVGRWVSRVPRNFTARRATLPEYRGRGRRPSRGALVRPLARTRKGHTLAATPPDRTERLLFAGRSIQADIWSGLCLPQAEAASPSFQCLVVRDPAYVEPWVLATNLPLAAAEVLAVYHARWPVEQVPLTAKQLLGAQRQFVFADAARQRLPELALVAGSLLMYLAATHPAQPTGFWDRTPRPTAGRFRRVLAQLDISKTAPLPRQLRKKESVTGHLPKGIQAHRRSARPIQARV